MNTYVFLIRTLTNLHAGSGDSGGFGVVDKSVQRDATTGLPTIHASGIKGALREYFKEVAPWEGSGTLERIFGSDQSDREKNNQRGQCRFFSADLIAMPRTDHKSDGYYRIIQNEQNTQAIKRKLELFGVNDFVLSIEKSGEGDLEELGKELPVIARNFLDNGVSKNLWYEEVVPRESYFLTIIQGQDDTLAKALDGKVVQLGGNATVGYGFCHFKQIYPTES